MNQSEHEVQPEPLESLARRFVRGVGEGAIALGGVMLFTDAVLSWAEHPQGILGRLSAEGVGVALVGAGATLASYVKPGRSQNSSELQPHAQTDNLSEALAKQLSAVSGLTMRGQMNAEEIISKLRQNQITQAEAYEDLVINSRVDAENRWINERLGFPSK